MLLHLLLGGAVVMTYWYPINGWTPKGPNSANVGGHFVLMTGLCFNPSSEGLITCINDERTTTVSHISLKELFERTKFRRRAKECYPQAWFLTKER